MGCTLLQSIHLSDCLRSSLSFVEFTATSKKMSFCSGSAAFHATHLRYMFCLEITCVQDDMTQCPRSKGQEMEGFIL